MPDDVFAVPSPFEEIHYEEGTYGPDNRDGFAVDFEAGSMVLRVLPVRYRRREGTEHIQGLTENFAAERDDPTVRPGHVEQMTAFVTRADFRPYDRNRQAIACVAADAGDALAAAVWLGTNVETDSDLARNAQLHVGRLPPSKARPALSDDDVLEATLTDSPEHCLLTNVETSSHEVQVPYRYAPILSGVKRTARGVIRFPSTVESLLGVVSHDAWIEHGLDELDFRASLSRQAAGRYKLNQAVIDLIDGVQFNRFGLRRLG